MSIRHGCYYSLLNADSKLLQELDNCDGVRCMTWSLLPQDGMRAYGMTTITHYKMQAYGMTAITHYWMQVYDTVAITHYWMRAYGMPTITHYSMQAYDMVAIAISFRPAPSPTQSMLVSHLMTCSMLKASSSFSLISRLFASPYLSKKFIIAPWSITNLSISSLQFNPFDAWSLTVVGTMVLIGTLWLVFTLRWGSSLPSLNLSRGRPPLCL